MPSHDVVERLQEALGAAYVIERELGGGGMSRIFLARELALGRRVVVKLLPPEYAAGVNGERFRHEILLAARLQHPHIVPILAAGEMHGVPYYTMPFIDGESLRWRLLRGDRLHTPEIMRILHDVIDALAYAHEHGVVHRDIKPDNVLMSRQHAVISDFGVAKALDAAYAMDGEATIADGESGMAIGTPAYMAPEQAAADPSTDHRADLYGFGVLAYELLTGQPPFSGREPLELLAAHVAETPIPILALQPDVPPRLADLVMRCLEKHPDLRPGSAAEVRDALEAIIAAPDVVPIAPAAPRFFERVSKLAAAAVLAVLGGGGAMAAHIAGERDDRGATMAEVSMADESATRKPLSLGPGLVEAHWIAKRRADVELPAAIAEVPEPTAPSGGRSFAAIEAPAAPKPAAPRVAAKEPVRVELRSKHGSARVVVSSLDGSRERIETMARRLQMIEAMAGPEGAVLAAAPAIDSIARHRAGDRESATVFVHQPRKPAAVPQQPRRQSPDAASAAPAAAPAPAPTAIVGMVDVEAVVRQAAEQLEALGECTEQAAQRLREQAARAKRGATS